MSTAWIALIVFVVIVVVLYVVADRVKKPPA